MKHVGECVLLVLFVCASIVDAAPRRASNPVRASVGLSAHQSASISASTGVMAHRGGSFRYEGVGFSSASADAALRNCCYWGTRPVVESAVVRGSRGWFACVRYR
jgi:hypothetical protein